MTILAVPFVTVYSILTIIAGLSLFGSIMHIVGLIEVEESENIVHPLEDSSQVTG